MVTNGNTPVPAMSTLPNHRFTLGISVEHFDFRVDLHRFIEALGAQADVVLLTDQPFAQPIQGLKEVRLYHRRRSLVSTFVQRLFLMTRRLPKSRNNFFITEMFELSLLPPVPRRRGLLYLQIRRFVPWGISVDAVLPWLGGGDATEIGDIDAFLHITRIGIGTLPFLRRTLTSGKPNAAYIYSWDHPCKHTTIPRLGLKTYFTWNQALNRDMVDLQGAPAESQRAVGATQLVFLKDYLATPAAGARLVSGEYVYYVCGTGSLPLVRQEVDCILRVASSLREVSPQTILLVRPYPILSDWSAYERLKREQNIQIDWFRQVGQGHQLTLAQIFEKYNKIEHARAIVHLGTTLGWEACYFDHPVLFLALDDLPVGSASGRLASLRKFIHQYHNDRYMILDGFPNVVRSTADLAQTLRGALERPSDFMAYNRTIAGVTPLRSLDEIAADILKELRPATVS